MSFESVVEAIEGFKSDLSQIKSDVESLKVPSSTRRGRKRKQPAPVCSGKTAKGTPCVNKRAPNSMFCRMHDPDRMSSRSKKIKRVKETPRHAHSPGEPNDACDVCDAHGDALDPNVLDVEYELVDTDDIDLSLPSHDGM